MFPFSHLSTKYVSAKDKLMNVNIVCSGADFLILLLLQ